MIKQLSPKSFLVDPKEDTVGLFICSDVHFDAKKCDRGLFAKHMKQAEKEGRVVIINGDFFDLMQGRYDPRSGKYDIRPEYKHANYLDQVIQSGVEELCKYNVNYLIGNGNHETNITKRLETSPIERLVTLMKYNGSNAIMMGYEGWITVRMKASSTSVKKYRIKFHHGAGAAKRSKGTLSIDIDKMNAPDADMLIKGHDHQKWHVPTMVEKIGADDEPYLKTVHALRTGSYKERDSTGFGWEVERDFEQPRLGGWFVDLSMYTLNNRRFVHTRVIEAD